MFINPATWRNPQNKPLVPESYFPPNFIGISNFLKISCQNSNTTCSWACGLTSHQTSLKFLTFYKYPANNQTDWPKTNLAVSVEVKTSWRIHILNTTIPDQPCFCCALKLGWHTFKQIMVNIAKGLHFITVRTKKVITERKRDWDRGDQSLRKSQKRPVMKYCHQAKWEKTCWRSDNKSRPGF